MVNSITTTVYEIGNVLSILFFLPVSDFKGRKFAAVHVRFGITIAVAVCHLLAALFQASEMFILGQFVLGFHHSLRTFATEMFLLECAPDNCRGFSIAGLIFSFMIAKLAMFSASSPSLLGTSTLWFIFPLFVMISSVVVLCFLLRFPESPKWLVQQNRVEEAKHSIQFYHGSKCHLNDVVNSIIKEKSLTKENTLSLRQIWENETLREGFKLVFAVLIFLGFDTSYVLSIYTIMVHKQAGFTVQMAMNITMIITIVLFPTKFIGPLILDTLGRRATLFIGGIMQYTKSILILTTSIVIYICGSSLLTEIMYVAVELLSILIPAIGATSIRMLLVLELFPPSARTAMGQATMLTSSFINTPITSLFPIVNSTFPPIFYVPFVFVQLFTGVYLYRHMPETNGRAVYDIIESLDKDVGSRAATIHEETPLIKDRARTFTMKRNSILNTPRTRALTFDHEFTPKN